IAIAPAFKMKFWNIGAEGQALVGCIISAVILYFTPASVPDPLVIVLALIGAAAAGMFFAFVPTFFKLKFNTNETLFTLLMNYVATPLALFTCAIVDKSGHNMFPQLDDKFPGRVLFDIAGIKYLPIIIFAVIITVVMYFYLKKTKQGFELSVLGDSTNTARYVGISRKVVSYRTMAISGAIAGLVGFLLVCCQNGSLSSGLLGGRGFTAVLIAWLGCFNPGQIALYSALVGFLDYGTNYVAGQPSIALDTTYFPGLIIGLFIFTVVIIEFFTKYKVKRNLPNEVSEARDAIINFPDSKIDSTVLFKEFCATGYYDLKVKLPKEKVDFTKAKQQFNKNTKQIRKQLFTNKDLTEKQKNNLTKDLQTLKNNYQATLNQYKNDKKLLRIKKQRGRMVIRANINRLKSVFKNSIATTLTILKSGSIVYNSKEEVNNFLKNVNYTKWQFSPETSIKKIFIAHKNMVKSNNVINEKCKKNTRVLASDITKAEEDTYNYYLLGSNFLVKKYLGRRKIYFNFMVRRINRHNIRQIRKKKREESRMQNKEKKI
ncbi:MAG: hypothetical protein MJ199_01820, partial [Bacilli bacterium]|nr:hypothetical protein [Bacilli bacterium]